MEVNAVLPGQYKYTLCGWCYPEAMLVHSGPNTNVLLQNHLDMWNKKWKKSKNSQRPTQNSHVQ